MCAIVHMLLASCAKWGPVNSKKLQSGNVQVHFYTPNLASHDSEMGFNLGKCFKTAISSDLEDLTSHMTRAAP